MAEPLGLEEVRRALAEDCVADDRTTGLLGARADHAAVGTFVAEGDLVVAGLGVATLTFCELDGRAKVSSRFEDGARVTAGDVLADVQAPARVLLAGERVALNFLQRLSGIASATRRAVDAVAGTEARITHTRKTTPGLRALECHAVQVGGGVANRTSLADAILWKDNHWALLNSGRSLAEALAAVPTRTRVMVEVENDRQLEAALAGGVTHLLADNQPPEVIAAWARRAGPGVTIEATGGITPERAAAYALAGARLISIGALTHSVVAAPIRFDIRTTD